MRRRFDMYRHNIGARVRECFHVAFGLDDHQMRLDRNSRRRADGRKYRQANRDVRHETAVHDIEMNRRRARCLRLPDLIAEMREVGGENRWRNARPRTEPFS